MSSAHPHGIHIPKHAEQMESKQIGPKTPNEQSSSQSGIHNPLPQNAPGKDHYQRFMVFIVICTFIGHAAAIGHHLENSIPLSIFPIRPDKFCICLCGIPGRGKTKISRRLGRYLEFFHAVPVKVIHVADYRRKLCGLMRDSVWFDPINEIAAAKREEVSLAAAQDACQFLIEHENGVIIFDSINETHQRRFQLTTMVRKNCKINIFF
jgi:hypothetical protein